MATSKQNPQKPGQTQRSVEPDDPTGEGGVNRNKPGVKVVEEPAVQTKGRVFDGFRPSQVKLGETITRIDH